MESITTTAIISTIVGYLAKKLKDNQTFQDFTKDFTSATINWIRPLFLVEDKPKEVLEKLTINPESEIKQKMAQTVLESELEDNPKAKEYLQEIFDKIKEKQSKGEKISISHSKNVVIGDVTAGHDFILGDNNQTGK